MGTPFAKPTCFVCMFFYAIHDQLRSNARMSLSQMYALIETDAQTSEFLSNGGFSVNKSKVPFSPIGSDHGIEQEKRALKVIWGIRGIAHSQQALDEYLLTTAEMGNMVESFCETFGIE